MHFLHISSVHLLAGFHGVLSRKCIDKTMQIKYGLIFAILCIKMFMDMEMLSNWMEKIKEKFAIEVQI